MSNYPKPSFVISQPNFSLVWFQSTNQFLVVQDTLALFFSEAVVQSELEYREDLKMLSEIHIEVANLMKIISQDNTNSSNMDTSIDDYKNFSLKDFKFSSLSMGKHKVFVYYSSKTLQVFFEAPYTYLKNNSCKSDKELIVLKLNNQFNLLSGKKLIYTTTKDQLFVLQAQFTNKLIEFYHSIKNPDWICAFHGCAVQKNNKTFLLLGISGSGKSTLSSLLSLSDYRFIADDLVLMDHDFKVYDNPAAVSVKEDSWPVIEGHYKPFANIKTSKKVKGQIKMKFLPLHSLQNNKPKSFNVDALIWVNFSKDQNDNLVPLNKKEVLSRLIPDTWICSELKSAKAFANWALGIKTFQLNYSDFMVAKELLDARL